MINVKPREPPPPTTSTTSTSYNNNSNNKNHCVFTNLWLPVDFVVFLDDLLEPHRTTYQEFPQLFPRSTTQTFLSCLEVCVVCLQATSQLWPVWPTCGDGQGLGVTSFRVLLWKCVRFKRSSCPLTTGWTYPIEAGRLIVGFALFFENGLYFGLGKNLRQTPGVRKFVANFSSELRVNIFQNRRKPSRRACSTGAGRCAKFDTSCIRWN